MAKAAKAKPKARKRYDPTLPPDSTDDDIERRDFSSEMTRRELELRALTSIAEMRAWSRTERSRRPTIGFVPSLGLLHPRPLRLGHRPRELAGLALSSRNTYLSPDERRAALALSRALRTLEQTWRGGEADPAGVQRAGLEAMRVPDVTPEYCALVDENLQPVSRVTAHTVAAVAARVGKTRLLDNVVLGEGIGADPRVTR